MVSQALIQAKVNLGLGKAASALGASCAWYRPISPLNALATTSLVGSLTAAFQTGTTNYTTPSNYGKPNWWGLFDATDVLVGDYLIEPTLGTFFVASLEPVHYPLCVRCNRTVTFNRPNPNPPGSTFYSGDVRGAGETTLMSGWPASVLQGTRGEKGPTQLPGDTRMPFMSILVPAFPGVTLQAMDLMADDLGNVWILSSCEQTALGWRLTAILADT